VTERLPSFVTIGPAAEESQVGVDQ